MRRGLTLMVVEERCRRGEAWEWTRRAAGRWMLVALGAVREPTGHSLAESASYHSSQRGAKLSKCTYRGGGGEGEGCGDEDMGGDRWGVYTP